MFVFSLQQCQKHKDNNHSSASFSCGVVFFSRNFLVKMKTTRIDNTVGTKKNSKLNRPWEDRSCKKLSLLPRVIPIEKSTERYTG